jgi:hypothetical protein
VKTRPRVRRRLLAAAASTLMALAVALVPHSPVQATHGGSLSSVDWGAAPVPSNYVIGIHYDQTSYREPTITRWHTTECTSATFIRGWLVESNWNNHIESFVGASRCGAQHYEHFWANPTRCGGSNYPFTGYTKSLGAMRNATSCIEWKRI